MSQYVRPYIFQLHSYLQSISKRVFANEVFQKFPFGSQDWYRCLQDLTGTYKYFFIQFRVPNLEGIALGIYTNMRIFEGVRSQQPFTIVLRVSWPNIDFWAWRLKINGLSLHSNQSVTYIWIKFQNQESRKESPNPRVWGAVTPELPSYRKHTKIFNLLGLVSIFLLAAYCYRADWCLRSWTIWNKCSAQSTNSVSTNLNYKWNELIYLNNIKCINFCVNNSSQFKWFFNK